jgi:YgiT-type zinc finger domain-containing protein
MCSICKTGRLKPGKTNVVLDRDDVILVFKDVPAQICDNCGEYYLDQTTSENIFSKAEKAVESGAEIEVVRYVA